MRASDRIIIENVLSLAKKKGWNNKQTADAIGITPQYFYRIKSGEKGIGSVMIRRITELFDLSEEELLNPLDHDQNHLATPKEGVQMEAKYLKIIEQKDRIIEQLQAIIDMLTEKKVIQNTEKISEKKGSGRLAG